MKNAIVLYFSFLVSISLCAQQEADNWLFGSKTHISFSSGNAQLVNDGSVSFQGLTGGATISDKNGQLLFFTDGKTIWNRLQQVMDNGSQITGMVAVAGRSFIVPVPGNRSQFYVFTYENGSGMGNVWYAVVDMNLNNGLGGVWKKQQFLRDHSFIGFTVIRHCNLKDYWLVIHDTRTLLYSSYLIDAGGISSNPVMSDLSQSGQLLVQGFTLKSSPDGRKIAETGIAQNSNVVQLTDFDPSTGKLSGPGIIHSVLIPGITSIFTTGAEFSSDSKILYIMSGRERNGIPEAVLYQFDISLTSVTGIAGSKQVIFSDNSANILNGIGAGLYGDLQMGADKKIYLGSIRGNASLHVINNPNSLGTACNFVFDGFYIGSFTYFLPNIIPGFYLRKITDNNDCQSPDVQFSVDNYADADSVKWDFDDPSSGNQNNSLAPAVSHHFSAPGLYKVRLIAYLPNACANDTLYRTVSIAGGLDFNLGSDTTLCTGEELTLGITVPDASYTWSTNATSSNINITQPGTYWQSVQLGSCIFSDTIHVNYAVSPVVNLGSDTTLCEGITLLLDAGNPGAIFAWQDNSSQQSFQVNQPGKYFVQVTQNGCTSYDTIAIGYQLKPRFTLGQDLTICQGLSFTLQPQINDPGSILSYEWQDGSSANTFEINAPGQYWLMLGNGCGITGDTLNVLPGVCRLFVPSAFTPNGDGLNDIFKAGYGENLETFRMEIYNRWGEKIFVSDTVSKGWDGTYKNKPMPAGIYPWIISYRDYGSETPKLIKGTVMIIR